MISKAFVELRNIYKQRKHKEKIKLLKQYVKEFVKEYKATVRKIKLEPNPPCLKCKDIQIVQCALSGKECRIFRKYCGGRNERKI